MEGDVVRVGIIRKKRIGNERVESNGIPRRKYNPETGKFTVVRKRRRRRR